MPVDESDFAAIYDQYYPKIVRYLKRLVGELESEDAAQEVFVKISRSLDSFRGESSMSTWIYRIATNTATDHLRRSSSKRLQSDSPSNDSELLNDGDSGPIDSTPPLDTLLIRKDMSECIQGIVNRLPDNYRSVLVLSDLEGFSNADIAKVLGISLETVKIRLHRARARLRKDLETNCHFYRDERNELFCDRKSTPLKFLKK